MALKIAYTRKCETWKCTYTTNMIHGIHLCVKWTYEKKKKKKLHKRDNITFMAPRRRKSREYTISQMNKETFLIGESSSKINTED